MLLVAHTLLPFVRTRILTIAACDLYVLCHQALETGLLPLEDDTVAEGCTTRGICEQKRIVRSAGIVSCGACKIYEDFIHPHKLQNKLFNKGQGEKPEHERKKCNLTHAETCPKSRVYKERQAQAALQQVPAAVSSYHIHACFSPSCHVLHSSATFV